AGWVEGNALVIGAGSNFANRTELPTDLITRAKTIVVDQLATARIESGDLIAANAAGSFDWERATELGTVLAPSWKAPGPPRPPSTAPTRMVPSRRFASAGRASPRPGSAARPEPPPGSFGRRRRRRAHSALPGWSYLPRRAPSLVERFGSQTWSLAVAFLMI